MARAGDDVVDGGELARVAGVHSPNAQAFLYFEMALEDLGSEQKAEVLSLLSPDLRGRLAANRPSVLQPSVVEVEGSAGITAIVTGYASYVQDRTEFRGFIAREPGKARSIRLLLPRDGLPDLE